MVHLRVQVVWHAILRCSTCGCWTLHHTPSPSYVHYFVFPSSISVTAFVPCAYPRSTHLRTRDRHGGETMLILQPFATSSSPLLFHIGLPQQVKFDFRSWEIMCIPLHTRTSKPTDIFASLGAITVLSNSFSHGLVVALPLCSLRLAAGYFADFSVLRRGCSGEPLGPPKQLRASSRPAEPRAHS